MKRLTFIIAISLSIVSCSKDKNDSPSSVAKKTGNVSIAEANQSGYFYRPYSAYDEDSDGKFEQYNPEEVWEFNESNKTVTIIGLHPKVAKAKKEEVAEWERVVTVVPYTLENGTIVMGEIIYRSNCSEISFDDDWRVKINIRRGPNKELEMHMDAGDVEGLASNQMISKEEKAKFDSVPECANASPSQVELPVTTDANLPMESVR